MAAHGTYSRVSSFREEASMPPGPSTPRTPLPGTPPSRIARTSKPTDSTASLLKTAHRPDVFNYKPFPLRTVPLLCLLAVTVAFIGLLEFAIRRLPHGGLAEDSFSKRDLVVGVHERSGVHEEGGGGLVRRRNETADFTTSMGPSAFVQTSKIITQAASTARTAFLDEKETTTVSTDTSAFVQTETASAQPYTSASALVQTRRTTPAASTGRTAFVDEKKTTTLSTDTRAFVKTGVLSEQASTNPSAYLQTEEQVSTKASAFVHTWGTESIAYANPVLKTTGKPVSGGQGTAFQIAETAYVNGDGTVSTMVVVAGGGVEGAQGGTAVPTDARAFAGTGTGLMTTAATAATAYVHAKPTDSPENPPHHDEPGGGSNRPDDGKDQDNGSSDNQGASLTSDDTSVVQVWNVQKTFLGTYLAVVIAVLYRLCWVTVYNAFNLIEPFRQLTQPSGALAENAFFAFYQSQSSLLGPIPALKSRRWALAMVGTALMLANLLPALASQSLFVDTNWSCPDPDLGDRNNPCYPRMTANATVLRVMQGMLCFAAVVLLCVTSLLLVSKTGLPGRPNSMATVASLMRHPRLLADWGEVPVAASSEEMARCMEGRRYKLGHYSCANGLSGYGILPFKGYEEERPVSPPTSSRHRYAPVESSDGESDSGKTRTRRFLWSDCVLAVLVVGSFVVVLAYYLDSNDDGFNRFFNSDTFGPRFILTLAGTVIASMWKSVEQDATVMAPYLRLAKLPSGPGSTILFTPSSTPISSTLRTLRHRYFFACAVTFLTLAAEALNIVISGVPYATGQTRQQFIVSAYMSIAILSLMIIVSGVIIVRRLKEPRIPRKPNTLGAVMSYFCGSRMLDAFEGMECLHERARDRRVKASGKRCEFCETVRRDGKLAWTVDEAFHQPKC